MWTCSTFSNRIFGCTYYKEEDNYAKTLRLTLEKVVMEHKECSDSSVPHSFYTIFINQYKERPIGGKCFVNKEDKEDYEDLCLDSAGNLGAFFRTYNPTNLLEEYIYRSRVKGYIGCKITKDREYNVDFAMYNTQDTFYHLYHHRFNNWLYNQVTGSTNDMLVYIIPTDKYYLLKYEPSDYTIKRGFLRQNINRKTKRPGHQCITCKVKHCMPRLINDLERI